MPLTPQGPAPSCSTSLISVPVLCGRGGHCFPSTTNPTQFCSFQWFVVHIFLNLQYQNDWRNVLSSWTETVSLLLFLGSSYSIVTTRRTIILQLLNILQCCKRHRLWRFMTSMTVQQVRNRKQEQESRNSYSWLDAKTITNTDSINMVQIKWEVYWVLRNRGADNCCTVTGKSVKVWGHLVDGWRSS